MRQCRPAILLGSITLAALLFASCDDGRPSALASIPRPTPVDPSPADGVRRILIEGNGFFTALGETRQFIATVTFNDGRSKDVTADGQWHSSNTGVVVVSATGEAKVIGFGTTTIWFEFEQQRVSVNIRAASPNTFFVKGRVREPGGGGVTGVTIVDTLSGRSAVSGLSGEFEIVELPSQRVRLKAEKEGYETREMDASGMSIDLPIQRIVRLVAGETVKPASLAPNDIEYVIGQQVCTCRLIRVVVPRAGTVAVHVRWSQMSATMHLFAEETAVSGAGELTTNIQVSAPRELVMYFGKAVPGRGDYFDFTFETALR